jgi:hypothetical protein
VLFHTRQAGLYSRTPLGGLEHSARAGVLRLRMARRSRGAILRSGRQLYASSRRQAAAAAAACFFGDRFARCTTLCACLCSAPGFTMTFINSFWAST